MKNSDIQSLPENEDSVWITTSSKMKFKHMLNSWKKKTSPHPCDHEKTSTILSQILYTQTCKSWEVNVRFRCQYQFILGTKPILIPFYKTYWGKDYRDLFVEKGDHKQKQRQVFLCIQNPPFNEKTWKNTPWSRILTHKR